MSTATRAIEITARAVTWVSQPRITRRLVAKSPVLSALVLAHLLRQLSPAGRQEFMVVFNAQLAKTAGIRTGTFGKQPNGKTI